MPTEEELREEKRKLRFLRLIVDLTYLMLHQENLSIMEALELMAATKKQVLYLFPDKEETYDLIYKPRFERVLKERLNSN